MLTPARGIRLDQIILQSNFRRRGPQVFTDREVVEALGLDKEQQQQVDALGEQWRTAMDERMRSPARPARRKRGPIQEARAEVWRRFQQQIMDLLSDQQKARWNELTGEPVDGELLLFGLRHEGFSHFGGGPRGHGQHRRGSRGEAVDAGPEHGGPEQISPESAEPKRETP